MAYNPNILSKILSTRFLSTEQLSDRLQIAPAELSRELDREPEPGQGILNRIAKELGVPPYSFFMEKAPALHDVLPDFRSSTAKPAAKMKETVQSIQFAEGVQRALEQFWVKLDLPQFSAKGNAEVDAFALAARELLSISLQDQLDAKDANAFYLVCRKKIEDAGIFVLHDSFPEQDGSGFCLSHPRHPVIVVNTRKQTKGRRLFTLIHELAHVLMRSTGISDPFITRNSVERICNRFAGSFLVPKLYVQALLKGPTTTQPDDEDVKWASRRLKISQEATVFRLEQLGIYTAGSYDRWKALVHGRNPDYFEKRGGPPGGEPPPQEKIKLSKYGFSFARAFDSLLRQGLISEVNLYRSTGLKPKYQRQYFDYVKSLTPDQLHTLELDDE
ncbi:ImmA/IrrE family metallo-endopeptidase [Bradyrhizobium viridifuturi]|nr:MULTISPECIES: ImmA/IrrE family metallo-endopeptidase [Bradyrhizobium]QRI72789.1 ImmA/IrrE family metallo-endopeptidase [Bradyrhizobium sp. PSBB068]MBR1020983.1 ImmA/IrrE family metallo-endopeptidase [Bradyrhizobium viridifuturi]MBR1035780.1 ImmA/IrrE family metallo-endopeptidase [Bradyrhizobium viridifuturi]MBR1044025.1 ImmA/IrrE family metallo-endopeptidase [Bradyrhizobium viridifuturi]MBR1073702.1 ImmA/IrrE family metallo-endopeptidase [Bradyrhizobium viridifuturi]